MFCVGCLKNQGKATISMLSYGSHNIHTIVFDFDGIFTDNKVGVLSDGSEFVICNRGDGLALDLLRGFLVKKNIKVDYFILSTERNQVVNARATKLKIPVYFDIRDKMSFLNKYFNTNRKTDKAPFDGMIFLGNDLNDLAVIQNAGYSVVPIDAHPLVKSLATEVLPFSGGQGFIRAFIERMLGISNLTIGEINELISYR